MSHSLVYRPTVFSLICNCPSVVDDARTRTVGGRSFQTKGRKTAKAPIEVLVDEVASRSFFVAVSAERMRR